jgi:hypothetical protein
VVDVRAAVGGDPAAADVLEVGVGVTIIRAMRVSLESRAGKEQHSIVQCRVFTSIDLPKKCPLEVSMSGRGRSSFTKRQKERSRQEKQREKAERKVQRKLEKPATGSDSFELSEEDFAAAAAQMALPGDSHLEE